MKRPVVIGVDAFLRTWVMALLGGVVGLALGAAVYSGLNPVLERSTGAVREMQGMLWNLVPLLTAVGLLLGWRWARRPH